MRALAIGGGIAVVVAILLFLIFGHSDQPVEQVAVEQKEKIYTTVEQCRVDHAAEECDKAFSGASARHEETAKRYAERSTCEDLYGPGQCVPRHTESGDFFMPYMMGFMLGQMSGSPVYRPVVIARTGYVYSGSTYIGSYSRDRSGGGGGGGGVVTVPAVTAPARGGFGSSTGTTTIARPSSPAPAATVPGSVARGGFGSTAAAVSSSAGS